MQRTVERVGSATMTMLSLALTSCVEDESADVRKSDGAAPSESFVERDLGNGDRVFILGPRIAEFIDAATGEVKVNSKHAGYDRVVVPGRYLAEVAQRRVDGQSDRVVSISTCNPASGIRLETHLPKGDGNPGEWVVVAAPGLPDTYGRIQLTELESKRLVLRYQLDKTIRWPSGSWAPATYGSGVNGLDEAYEDPYFEKCVGPRP